MINSFAGCIHSGVRYDHGATWKPAENPCGVCYCVVGLALTDSSTCSGTFTCTDSVLSPHQEGHVRCERERCNTPCSNPAAPPAGTCCPVCQGGFLYLAAAACRGFSELQRRVCLCVLGCGMEGQDFPNGARVPTGDRCQECACVVCHLHSHHMTCCLSVRIIWRSFNLKVHG